MQNLVALIENLPNISWEILLPLVYLVAHMVMSLVLLLISRRSSKQGTQQNSNLINFLQIFAQSLEALILSLQVPSKTEVIQESSNNTQLSSLPSSQTSEIQQQLQELEQVLLKIKEDIEK